MPRIAWGYTCHCAVVSCAEKLTYALMVAEPALTIGQASGLWEGLIPHNAQLAVLEIFWRFAVPFEAEEEGRLPVPLGPAAAGGAACRSAS